MAVAIPAQALAETGQAKDGSINCGYRSAYSHSRYNDRLQAIPPGDQVMVRVTYSDGLWHVKEIVGETSGYWQSVGFPSLDLANTWASCRNGS